MVCFHEIAHPRDHALWHLHLFDDLFATVCVILRLVGGCGGKDHVKRRCIVRVIAHHHVDRWDLRRDRDHVTFGISAMEFKRNCRSVVLDHFSISTQDLRLRFARSNKDAADTPRPLRPARGTGCPTNDNAKWHRNITLRVVIQLHLSFAPMSAYHCAPTKEVFTTLLNFFSKLDNLND